MLDLVEDTAPYGKLRRPVRDPGPLLNGSAASHIRILPREQPTYIVAPQPYGTD